MAETTILNRPPETYGMRIERERLVAETPVSQVETKTEFQIQVPPHVGQNVKLIPPAGVPNLNVADPRTAEAIRAEQTGKLEVPETKYSPEAELISQALKMGRADDEFRKRVIAAFKHLGLDTNKFFGA